MSFESLGPGKFPECHFCEERKFRLSKVPQNIRDGDYFAETTLVEIICKRSAPGSSLVIMGGTIHMDTPLGKSSTTMDERLTRCPGLEGQSN